MQTVIKGNEVAGQNYLQVSSESYWDTVQGSHSCGVRDEDCTHSAFDCDIKQGTLSEPLLACIIDLLQCGNLF